MSQFPPTSDRLRTRWLGRLPFVEAWDLQRAFWETRVEETGHDDVLLLLEHPPVYTLGRNGDGSNLLVSQDELTASGTEFHQIDRGGDITYHGPGQLVGYPILALADPKQIVPYVRKLEQTIIGALAEFDIEAWSEEGLTGVWTHQGKVAAIGVRVSRGVTMHGFSLNVNTDLSAFGAMHPCGITDRSVTSVSELLGKETYIEDLVPVIERHFVATFGYSTVDTQHAAFVRGQGRPREFLVDQLIEAGTFSAHRHSMEPVLFKGRLMGEPDRPEWMKVKANMGTDFAEMKKLMRGLELNTVCEEAGCPNIYECWGQGTATIMILGEFCTRACSFCDVNTGKPTGLDLMEPFRVAEAVKAMGLEHAVITSVNRDDLDDGGSEVFAATIREIRRSSAGTSIEVLIPDFKGDTAALDTVMAEKPEVLNHNTETVLRLQRDVRTAANYGRSLALLARAKKANPDGRTKSGLIVGMGETEEEVLGALDDLHAVGVNIVTIGQYLRPTPRHARIVRYVHPDEFARYKAHGEGLGIDRVESGPLVRSSYHAKESAQLAPA